MFRRETHTEAMHLRELELMKVNVLLQAAHKAWHCHPAQQGGEEESLNGTLMQWPGREKELSCYNAVRQ